MKVYVANLEAYNNGELRGEWFYPSIYDKPEDFEAAVHVEVLGNRDIDYAIHDYEDALGLRIGEYDSLRDVWSAAMALEATACPEAFAAWADNEGLELSQLEDELPRFRQHYVGAISLKAYAADFADEVLLPGVPDEVRRYFDYDRFARDMELGGDYFELTDAYGQPHVFSSH